MKMRDENISALQQRIDAPLLGVASYMENPDSKLVASQLDLKQLQELV